jgi:beta-lactamase regulating signal transducer with metallopeptidase domain
MDVVQQLQERVLSAEVVQRLGWALLHSLWELAAVALALTACLAALRRRGARARYAAACAAMAATVVLPVLTFCLAPPASPAAALGGASPPGVAAPRATGQAAPGQEGGRIDVPASTIAPGPAAAARPWLPWVVAAWLAGVLALCTWNVGGWVALQRLRRLGTSPVPEAVARRTAALVRRMSVAPPVRVLQSALVDAPAVLGWLRPVVLVPAAALAGLSPHELDAILAHELAHVRRRDYLANLLQTLAETLLFYHPAVWWVSAQVRREREHCCDDAAAEACGDRVLYAGALGALEGLRAPARLALAANAGSLLGRIRRVLGLPAGEQGAGTRGAVGAASLALLVLAALLSLGTPPVATAGDAGAKGGAPAAAATTRPSGAATRPAAAATQPAQKNFRTIFKPGPRKAGKTHWTRLFRPQEGDGKVLMAIITAYLGDPFPVSRVGQKETLFTAEMTDGNDDRVQVQVTRPDGTKQALELVRDKPVKITVAGQVYRLAYSSTQVAAVEQPVWDNVTIFITHHPDEAPDEPPAGAAPAEKQPGKGPADKAPADKGPAEKGPDRKISAGDKLNVTIADWDGPGLDWVKDVPVDADGNLALPGIGKVPAKGTTCVQLERQILEKSKAKDGAIHHVLVRFKADAL